jgi:ABC-type transport system involved in multi-copper enzyme maturation permease subunit
MFKKPWVLWVSIFASLVVVGAVAVLVLFSRELNSAAETTLAVFEVLVFGWCYWGLWKVRSRMWAKRWAIYLGVTNVMGILVYALAAAGVTQWAAVIKGLWFLLALSIGGVWLIRQMVGFGHPIAGVARTVIDQATRYNIVWVVIIIKLGLIVGLPMWLDSSERLDYLVGFYLTASMIVMTILLSLLTILLACFSVCNDLTDKHIFMLASKPVRRIYYLVGKWLGLALLNLVLVSIAGVGIWIGANYLADTPLSELATPEDVRNKQRVRSEVLTARVTGNPRPPQDGQNFNELFEQEFQILKEDNPGQYPATSQELDAKTRGAIQGKLVKRWMSIKAERSKEYVFYGLLEYRERFKQLTAAYVQRVKELQDEIVHLAKASGKDRVENQVEGLHRYEVARAELTAEQFNKRFPMYNDVKPRIQEDMFTQFEPEQFPRAERLFARLQKTLPPRSSLKLRLKPKQPSEADDGKVRMRLEIAQKYRIVLPAIPEDTVYDKAIPTVLIPELIDDQGTLSVRVYNSDIRGSTFTHKADISFERGEGLVLMYTAGSFEGNLVRSMAVQWIKLSFVAMLSIMGATLLGFPMACLFGLFVYLTALFSSYMTESLHYYAQLDTKDKSAWGTMKEITTALKEQLSEGNFEEVLKLCAKMLGEFALNIIPSFSGAYDPIPMVSEGQFVPNAMVTAAALKVGLIWTGVCLLIGWLIYRRRELAQITV